MSRSSQKPDDLDAGDVERQLEGGLIQVLKSASLQTGTLVRFMSKCAFR